MTGSAERPAPRAGARTRPERVLGRPARVPVPAQPLRTVPRTSSGAVHVPRGHAVLSVPGVLRLQCLAGNRAVTELLTPVQREPAIPHTTPAEAGAADGPVNQHGAAVTMLVKKAEQLAGDPRSSEAAPSLLVEIDAQRARLEADVQQLTGAAPP